MAETIINEYGQKVRVYDWKEYQRRIDRKKPYTGREDLAGKVLVVKHTWGIGDVLYSTPAIHALKQKFPTCRIYYICTHPDILENNPDVDDIYHYLEYDRMLEMSDKLDREGQNWYHLDYDVPLKGGFDYKINLRPKPQMNEHMMELLKKNPKLLSGDERAFVDQASSAVINRYSLIALDTYCKHAYVEPKEKTVYYHPYESELATAREFLRPLRERGKKIITLLPHASTSYKDYPHWKRVMERLGPKYFWVVLDSFIRPGETWAGPYIFNASGAFRVRHTAALVIEADLCCSSDTGLLYPRAAMGRPCVVTYGPHDPEPFLHYFPSAHGLRIPVLKKTEGMIGQCSVGCYIDTTSCYGKGTHAPCLTELEPDIVADKITELLGDK